MYTPPTHIHILNSSSVNELPYISVNLPIYWHLDIQPTLAHITLSCYELLLLNPVLCCKVTSWRRDSLSHTHTHTNTHTLCSWIPTLEALPQECTLPSIFHCIPVDLLPTSASLNIKVLLNSWHKITHD